MAIDYILLKGKEIAERLDDFGRLRITVFKEFPYLYEGDLAYEKKYLQVYINSPTSLVVLASENGKVIGATTCLRLSDESQAIQQPFLDRSMDCSKICYFGESIILKEFRGRGIGSEFFRLREAHAQQSIPDLQYTTFCAVVRPTDHPLRPPGYVPLNEFWKKRGYEPQKGMIIYFPWQDIDKTAEDKKALQVWTKKWSN